MTKNELIEHFQEQKRIAEKEIAFWKAQEEGLIAPDAEPEKPKLGHGDFGIGYDKRPFVLKGNGKEAEAIMENGHIQNWGENYPDPGRYFGATKLGNIFDLLKEWGEDLTEYKKTSDKCNGRIELRLKSIDNGIVRPFGDTPETVIWFEEKCGYFSVSEAEEIWRKFGQMLATLKRKDK